MTARNAFEYGLGAWDEAHGEVGVHRRGIEFSGDCWVEQQGLDLGTKNETVREGCIEEGLYADAVAGEKERWSRLSIRQMRTSAKSGEKFSPHRR